MYSRNQAKGSGITIPENYDGVAFTDMAPEPQPTEGADRSIRVVGTPSQETKRSPGGFLDEEGGDAVTAFKENEHDDGGLLSGLFGKLPSLGGLLSGGLASHGIRWPRIGTEELLILGIALFLLFTKEGDKECAIMLILLIFVGN